MRLILLALFMIVSAAKVRAETVLLVFTDYERCTYCVAYKKTLEDPQVKASLKDTRVQIIETKNVTPAYLRAWQVVTLPTTVLANIQDRRATRIFKRRAGYMTPKQLIEFLED